ALGCCDLRRARQPLPCGGGAVARPEISKTRQERLRAAVLRRAFVVLREDRAMARPAGGLAAARDDGDHDVRAGGRRGEHALTLSSFRGAQSANYDVQLHIRESISPPEDSYRHIR